MGVSPPRLCGGAPPPSPPPPPPRARPLPLLGLHVYRRDWEEDYFALSSCPRIGTFEELVRLVLHLLRQCSQPLIVVWFNVCHLYYCKVLHMGKVT